MKRPVKLVIKGFLMGMADVVPGVSGGTMAFILGIYKELIESIKSFDLVLAKQLLTFKFKQAFDRGNLIFLMPLLVGILLAIIFFTKIISLPGLIISHPEQVYGLFFGLIIGSIYILMAEIRKMGSELWTMLFVGIFSGLLIVNLVPVSTPDSLWFIFLCGFIAISAMLLPGISGSFLLLILGKYAYVLDAVGNFEVAIIASFLAGALCGLIVFSRGIAWLLDGFYQSTIVFIKGLLIGSLWAIWPFQERYYEIIRSKQKLIKSYPYLPTELDFMVVSSVSLAVVGFLLVFFVHKYANAKKTDGIF